MLVTTKLDATIATNLATSPANAIKNNKKDKDSDEEEVKDTKKEEDKETIGEEITKKTQTTVSMCAPHNGMIEPKFWYLSRCLTLERRHLPSTPPMLCKHSQLSVSTKLHENTTRTTQRLRRILPNEVNASC